MAFICGLVSIRLLSQSHDVIAENDILLPYFSAYF